ncbi:SAM-dependent methyltransferase [Plantactinospora sp. BC1]|uniref:class I SAM-dependent methyltransferase n=1 Tax=Plantactinospora sp. BC1 TaxID=2108470 RepID=UPI0018FE7D6C
MTRAGLGPDTSVIDVGGGASHLVDRLLERDIHDITVLDVAATALQTSRDRLGHTAAITWITADLLQWQPERRYQWWHDRAVFHFLADPADRARYACTVPIPVAPAVSWCFVSLEHLHGHGAPIGLSGRDPHVRRPAARGP